MVREGEKKKKSKFKRISIINRCGHCRKLLPVLADVAEHYKSQSDVRIVKIDAEKNKNVAMRFGFQGFPAMVFYAKNSKAHEFYKVCFGFVCFLLGKY